jgi:hypothetical protein
MIAKINLTVLKPKDIPDEDFVEWIKYHCGRIEELSPDNKMAGVDLEDHIDQKAIRYEIIKTYSHGNHRKEKKRTQS